MRQGWKSNVVVAVIVGGGLMLAGCGDVVDTVGADSAAPEDARAPSDRTGDETDPRPSCQSLPRPAAGSPCDAAPCEYGSSPFLDCDELATCSATESGDRVWSIEQPDPALCAAATSACAGAAPVAGKPCSGPGLCSPVAGPQCDTAAGTYCYCYPTQTTMTWMCVSHGPGCPPVRPRLGAACTTDADVQCSYAGVDVMECMGGVWEMRVNP
jgi:hypothetical protein